LFVWDNGDYNGVPKKGKAAKILNVLIFLNFLVWQTRKKMWKNSKPFIVQSKDLVK